MLLEVDHMTEVFLPFEDVGDRARCPAVRIVGYLAWRVGTLPLPVGCGILDMFLM